MGTHLTFRLKQLTNEGCFPYIKVKRLAISSVTVPAFRAPADGGGFHGFDEGAEEEIFPIDLRYGADHSSRFTAEAVRTGLMAEPPVPDNHFFTFLHQAMNQTGLLFILALC